jgi:hypothetical protein
VSIVSVKAVLPATLYIIPTVNNNKEINIHDTIIENEVINDTIDTHTKGQNMQPNTDGAHRNRPTLKQNL